MLVDQGNSIPISCFNIPIDLEINILERLPVKTLVTITAVCKSWYSIVKNPSILNRYRNSSIVDPEQEGRALLISRKLTNDNEIECVVISHDSFVVRQTFAFNFVFNDGSRLTNIGSCCNGVICMSEYEGMGYEKEVYLFNPSIRKLRCLPSSSNGDRIVGLDTEVGSYVGFGYDDINDDYKVVKLYHKCKFNAIIRKFTLKLEAEVYSLTSDTWKTVGENDHRYYHLGPSVSVNNATHWLCSVDDDGHFHKLIVAFDFSGEVFREIELPIDFENEKSMVSYKGSLAILEIEGIDEEFEEDDESEEEQEEMSTVSLWIMKEYGVKESWSKVFTKVIHTSFYEAINFTKNGKLIFRKRNSELAIWDPETEQVVDLVGFSDKDYIIVEDYIESLILI